MTGGMMRGGWLMLPLLLLPGAPLAGEKSPGRAADSQAVREWCERQSKAKLRRQEMTPYNWSASWWDEVNRIVVEGEWRVNDGRARVRCEAERGRSLKQAEIEISYE